jgi:hypothetical protein
MIVHLLLSELFTNKVELIGGPASGYFGLYINKMMWYVYNSNLNIPYFQINGKSMVNVE